MVREGRLYAACVHYGLAGHIIIDRFVPGDSYVLRLFGAVLLHRLATDAYHRDNNGLFQEGSRNQQLFFLPRMWPRR